MNFKLPLVEDDAKLKEKRKCHLEKLKDFVSES